MATRTGRSPRETFTVKVVGPDGKSRSLTVYGVSSLDRIAKQVEFDLNNHWQTTRISDRRHQRR